MKTLEQLQIVREVSTNHPFGAIINETNTADGTPVVREVYNDHLVNHYKLLQEVGLSANGLEDNETNGYQVLEALKKLPNKLNDIEQVLDFSGNTFSVSFDLAYLPDKYFFIARSSSAYVSGVSYNFSGNGSGGEVYSFSSPTGFNASDELLVIIDQSGVRAYSVAGPSISTAEEIFTVMGSPLSFNDSEKLYYKESGNLMNDNPKIEYLEDYIRVQSSDGTIIVNDMFILQGFVLCFCYSIENNTYSFYQFDMNGNTSAIFVDSGSVFGTGTDFSPYVYTDGTYLYATNSANNSANDFALSKLNYSASGASISLNSTVNLNTGFVKNTNAVIVSNRLVTLVEGVLSYFNLSSDQRTILGTYNNLIGNLFKFNGSTYFTSGEVAKKWIV